MTKKRTPTLGLVQDDDARNQGSGLAPQETAPHAEDEASHYPVPLLGVYTAVANTFTSSLSVIVGRRYNSGLKADGLVAELRMSRSGAVRVTVDTGAGPRHVVIGAANVMYAEELAE